MKTIVPLINLQRILKKEGKIRLGIRREGKRGDGSTYTRPDRLEEFRFTSSNREVLEELAVMYGGTVTPWEGEPGQFELVSKANEIFVTLRPGISEPRLSYEYWTAKDCQRRCNGEVCEMADGGRLVTSGCRCQDRNFLMSQLPEKKRKLTGDDLEAALEDVQCKKTTRIQLQLAGTTALGVWTLESHGYFAMTELAPTVTSALQVSGGMPILMILALEPRELDQGRRKFVVPVLRVAKNASARLQALGGVNLAEVIAAPVLAPSPAALGYQPPAGYNVDLSTGELVENDDAAIAIEAQIVEDPFVAAGDAETLTESEGLAYIKEHVKDEVKLQELQSLAAAGGKTLDEIGMKAKAKGWTGFPMIKSLAEAS